MIEPLKPTALGLAAAIVSAMVMLILGILGNLGLYLGAIEMMKQMHLFFSLSLMGIISGMIEAAIISFIFAYLLGFLYNRLI